MGGLLGSQPQYGLLGPGMSPGLLGRQPYDPANETYWTPQTAGSPSLGIDETNYQWGDYSNQPGDIARFFMGKPPITPEQEAQLRTTGGGEGTAALGLGANMLPGGGIADYFFGTPGMGGRNFGDNVMAGEWGEAGGQLLGLGADALYAVNPLAAIFAGVAAKTADMSKLATAKKLAEAGTDPAKIWTDTGWFKGVDDQWRFEIPDDAAFIRGEPRQGYPLASRFRHLDAWDAYDDMRGINYRPLESATDRGQYRPGVAGVEGTEYIFATPDSQLKSTTLHEMQHAIQNREGFARGGSPEAMAVDFSKAKRRWEGLSDAWQIKTELESGKTISEVLDEFRALDMDWADDALMLAKEHSAADLRKMADDAFQDVKSIRDPFSTYAGDPGKEGYRKLAGEVEARNVQTRMDMTPEERLASPPWETQDVPNDQQIVRFGGEGPQASVLLPGKYGEATELTGDAGLTKANQIADDVLAGGDRVLYHSGNASVARAQAETGVIPQHGEWVREVLSGAADDDLVKMVLESSPELAWFSDHPDWILAKVRRATGNRNVTLDDVRNHGHLSIVRPDEFDSVYRVGEDGIEAPNASVMNVAGDEVPLWDTDIYATDPMGNWMPPTGVERNEWITTDALRPEAVLTGDELVAFMDKVNPSWREGLSTNQPLARNVTNPGRTGRPIE